MADQILKDKSGHIIGKISASSNGVQTIKDANGHAKGSYDPKANKTKDANGHAIGTGNLLATLL